MQKHMIHGTPSSPRFSGAARCRAPSLNALLSLLYLATLSFLEAAETGHGRNLSFSVLRGQDTGASARVGIPLTSGDFLRSFSVFGSPKADISFTRPVVQVSRKQACFRGGPAGASLVTHAVQRRHSLNFRPYKALEPVEIWIWPRGVTRAYTEQPK